MTAEADGWFVYRFDGIDSAHFVFNDAQGRQTGDLERDREGWFHADGQWHA